MNRMYSRQRVAFAAFALCLAASAGAADRASQAKPQFLNSPEAEQRDLPFSEAVRAGDFLFLAGQIGTDPKSGQVVAGGLAPEARQALNHIKSVLERNGASLKDVVKCTVFLADMKEWPAFNTIYREFFVKPYPARSALGTNGLALGARVEVECIAYAPQK